MVPFSPFFEVKSLKSPLNQFFIEIRKYICDISKGVYHSYKFNFPDILWTFNCASVAPYFFLLLWLPSYFSLNLHAPRLCTIAGNRASHASYWNPWRNTSQCTPGTLGTLRQGTAGTYAKELELLQGFWAHHVRELLESTPNYARV